MSEDAMAWVVAGVLEQIDRGGRRITIGGQTYELLPSVGALDPELALGMSVTASLIDSGGVRRVAELKPASPPRYTTPHGPLPGPAAEPRPPAG